MVGASTTAQVRELIAYACPTGELARQLGMFFDASFLRCGPNTAHRYMPHCTLTGFFHDELSALPAYQEALDCAHARALVIRPVNAIAITGMRFQDNFYYLEVDSPWLLCLTADFVARAASPTRRDGLRLKDMLHLSLAYGFEPAKGTCLMRLAREMVDPTAPVGWELRLYEHHLGDRWTVHGTWPLV